MADNFYESPNTKNIMNLTRANPSQVSLEGTTNRSSSLIDAFNSIGKTLASGVQQISQEVAARNQLAARDNTADFDAYVQNNKYKIETIDDFGNKSRLSETDEDPEKLKKVLATLKQNYIKERGLDKTGFSYEANQMLDSQVTSFTSPLLKVQQANAQTERDGQIKRGTRSVIESMMETDEGSIGVFNTLQLNDPVEILAAGSEERLKQLRFQGIMESVISAEPSLQVYKFTKSEEFKNQFGDMPLFDKTVRQMDKYTEQVKHNNKRRAKDDMLDKFYQTWQEGLLDTQTASAILDTTTQGYKDNFDFENNLVVFEDEALFSEKEKISLMGQLKKDLDKQESLREALSTLNKGLETNDNGLVNSVPKELRDEVFKYKVTGGRKDYDLNDPEQLKNLAELASRNFDISKRVTDRLFNPNLSNEDLTGLTQQLKTYTDILQIGGPRVANKLYTQNQQAKFKVLTDLSFDSTVNSMDDKEKKEYIGKVLDEFDKDSQNSQLGIYTDTNIKSELLAQDSSIRSEIESASMEDKFLGIFGGTVNPYKQQRLSEFYYTNRLSKMKPDDALRKAKEQYTSTHASGKLAGNTIVIPREFGNNESGKDLETFMTQTGIYGKLADVHKLPVGFVKKDISLEPDTMYAVNNTLNVTYQGQLTGIDIKARDFNKYLQSDLTFRGPEPFITNEELERKEAERLNIELPTEYEKARGITTVQQKEKIRRMDEQLIRIKNSTSSFHRQLLKDAINFNKQKE